MFIFGKLVWALLQPGNLLTLCLVAGVLFYLVSRGRRGKVLVGLSALGFVLFAVAPIGPAMLLALEERFPRPAQLPDRIDGMLLLGGAVDPALSLSFGETVFNSAVARVLGAVALARRHPEAKLVLVSGEGGFFQSAIPKLVPPWALLSTRELRPPAFFWRRSLAVPMKTPSIPESCFGQRQAKPGFSSPRPTTCRGPWRPFVARAGR